MNVLYLHGFASSPTSRKALGVRDLLARHGIFAQIPDLNLPSFTCLTLTAMVAEVERRIGDQTVIFGSSLGGYLAALVASRHPERVAKLVLMAPAVEFPTAFVERTAEAAPRWARGERVPVFHHGEKQEVPFAGDLAADCAHWPSAPAVRCPTLVFAGAHDDVIPLPTIERWVAAQPSATLRVLDDGHELAASLPAILAESARFLGLNPLT